VTLDVALLDTTAPFGIVWRSVLPGRYALTAVAADNFGATTSSSRIQISVRGADLALRWNPYQAVTSERARRPADPMRYRGKERVNSMPNDRWERRAAVRWRLQPFLPAILAAVSLTCGTHGQSGRQPIPPTPAPGASVEPPPAKENTEPTPELTAEGSLEDRASADPDEDGIMSADDNCPGVANLDQKDSDGDGYGYGDAWILAPPSPPRCPSPPP